MEPDKESIKRASEEKDRKDFQELMSKLRKEGIYRTIDLRHN